MPCPICRQEFKVPREGFSGLPNNFDIVKLIELANAPNPPENLCDVCLSDDDELGSLLRKADRYCIECKKKLCEECCKQHRDLKLTKSHKLLPIDEKQQRNDKATTYLAPSVCKLHEGRVLEVYCADCKTVECAVCFIDGHRHHEGSHVSQHVDGFSKTIESSIETINQCCSETEMKKAELVKVKDNMQQKVELLESEIMNRRDELKRCADTQADSLLQNLCLLRQGKLKEIQMEISDIDAHLLCLQSYRSKCQKILADGLASVICLAVSDLSVKTTELKEQCQSLVGREMESFKVSFTKSEVEKFLEDKNFIGEIEDENNLTAQRKASTACTSKVALIKKSSEGIELLKKDINLEISEKETLRLENYQLKMSLNSEKATYKTLQVEHEKLKQELETQLNAMQEMRKREQQTNEDWEQTKTDWIAKIIGVEQQREVEEQTWITEKRQLIVQLEEQRILINELLEHNLDPVLDQTIRTKASEEKKREIRGLTILDNELFVVNEKSSEVEVYDSTELSFSRRWILKELIRPKDIQACKRNKCLYILDYKSIRQQKIIFRVDTVGKLINSWSTGDFDPPFWDGSLSVTAEGNVVLAALREHKVTEFSPEGQFIREINLKDPWHAIKLTNGNFLVSNGSEDLHRVCIIDEDGIIMKSFGGNSGSIIGQMNQPVHLSVGGSGSVMVIDQVNRQVLLLDSDLKFKRELLSKDKHGLQDPIRILLDDSNGRLFVADNGFKNNYQILVFSLRN